MPDQILVIRLRIDHGRSDSSCRRPSSLRHRHRHLPHAFPLQSRVEAVDHRVKEVSVPELTVLYDCTGFVDQSVGKRQLVGAGVCEVRVSVNQERGTRVGQELSYRAQERARVCRERAGGGREGGSEDLGADCGGDLDTAGEAGRNQSTVDVAHGGEDVLSELIPDRLVPNGDVTKGDSRPVGGHVAVDPVISGRGTGGQGLELCRRDVHEELNAGIGEGSQDVLVGAVQSHPGDAVGLTEAYDLGRRGEVGSLHAIANSDELRTCNSTKRRIKKQLQF